MGFFRRSVDATATQIDIVIKFPCKGGKYALDIPRRVSAKVHHAVKVDAWKEFGELLYVMPITEILSGMI